MTSRVSKSRKMAALSPEVHQKLRDISERTGVPMFKLLNDIVESYLDGRSTQISSRDTQQLLDGLLILRNIGFFPVPFLTLEKMPDTDWGLMGISVGKFMRSKEMTTFSHIKMIFRLFMYIMGVTVTESDNSIVATGNSLSPKVVSAMNSFFENIIKEVKLNLKVEHAANYMEIRSV